MRTVFSRIRLRVAFLSVGELQFGGVTGHSGVALGEG